MQGRRTILIAAVVALVAAAATLGIAALHRSRRRAPRPLRDADRPSRPAPTASSALEWEATARRRVPLRVQAEVTEHAGPHAGRNCWRSAAQAATAPAGALRRLREAASRRSRRSSRSCVRATSSAPPRSTIASLPRSTLLRADLRAAAARNRALAARSDRMSWIGTVAVMVLLVVGLTALLALLDRAGRRRLRDGDLRRLAFEDSLTGLPNRSLFEQRIAETLAAGRARRRRLPRPRRLQARQRLARPRRRRPPAGDLPANGCATRCAPATPSPAWAATSSRSSPSTPTDVEALVARLFEVLAAPVMLEGKRLHLRASIGIATTEAGDDLLRNADLAMYAAKAAGTNRFAIFTDDMHVNAVARLDRREQLERAIENEELVLHYQPIVDLDLGRVAGFEALVRWQHPDPRLPRPGRVHPARRGDRPDRPAGPLGPARGRPPGRDVGRRPVPERQRRGRPARAARLRRRGRPGARPTAASTPRAWCWKSPNPPWSATSRPNACRRCAASACASRSTTSAPATRR